MKIWKLVLFVVVIILAGAGLYLAYSKYDSARDEQAQIKRDLAAKKLQEENTVPAKAKKALENNLRLGYNLEVSYDETSKTLVIVDSEANPAEGVDNPLFTTTYTNILNRGYFLFVHGGKEVFGIPGIEKLTVIQKMPISTDGIENTAVGMEISTSKARFLAVDWESYNEKPIHQTVSSIADNYGIHAQLRRVAPPASVLMPN